MTTRALDKDGDWTFGQGFDNYLIGQEEIVQNITTRLKTFYNDWFLDTEAGIDWFSILGNKSNKDVITREVSRVVLGTPGVISIKKLEILGTTGRDANILLSFVTIYSKVTEQVFGVSVT